jgi:hypothetical protein
MSSFKEYKINKTPTLNSVAVAMPVKAKSRFLLGCKSIVIKNLVSGQKNMPFM